MIRRQQDGLLWLVMNRPQAANALDSGLAAALAAALDEAERDGGTRAVILSGAGDKAFCAGVDIKNSSDLPREEWRAEIRRNLRLVLDSLLASRKPVLAALNGAAAGGGCMAALLADLVVASDNATLSLPEADLGIASFTGYALVASLAGDALAHDLVLTGRRMSAQEAMQRGLVARVCPPAELERHAEEIARALASKPPDVLSRLKAWSSERRARALEAGRQASHGVPVR